MQPIKCNRALKISVQENEVEREMVQPCLPVAYRQAHFFLLSSEMKFIQ
jgi:hypothetical protein